MKRPKKPLGPVKPEIEKYQSASRVIGGLIHDRKIYGNEPFNSKFIMSKEAKAELIDWLLADENNIIGFACTTYSASIYKMTAKTNQKAYDRAVEKYNEKLKTYEAKVKEYEKQYNLYKVYRKHKKLEDKRKELIKVQEQLLKLEEEIGIA